MRFLNTPLICPPPLKKGDTVAIIALASKLNPDDILQAIELMENQWGLKVIVGESVRATYFNFAGTDELRLKDFQENLDNQEVKAIFSARGGYGTSRIIDNVDFSKFKENPKWVVGFSDITEALNKIQALGFQAIHGPMPKSFMRDDYSLSTLKAILFNEKQADYITVPNELNRIGEGNGIITGGNLCMLTHIIGTSSDISTDGKILFIEDIGEYFYTLDRMMIHLKRAGKLSKLQGLIVGTFSSLKTSDEPFGKTVNEIIASHVEEYNFPTCFDFPIGHEDLNWAVPCGRIATLKVSNEEVRLSFADEIIT